MNNGLMTRGGRTLAARPYADFFGGFDPFRNFATGSSTFAGIDVVRTENGGYVVEIPVPGYKPDQIDVTLEDSVLTVTGKNDRRQFSRSLLLPEEIDGENVGAKVEHGLLTLTLNVHPKAQPKKIEVRIGEN